MFRLIMINIYLLIISPLWAETNLVEELTKLNLSSKHYIEECKKFQDIGAKIEAIKYGEDPSFKSKELFFAMLEHVTTKAPSFPEDSKKAWSLLWNSKNNFPKSKEFLKAVDGLQFECDLFLKYDFFLAYALNYQSLQLNMTEKKLIMERFKKFMRMDFQGGVPVMSVLTRMNILHHFTKNKLLGSVEDIKDFAELYKNAEIEFASITKKNKEINDSITLKKRLELANKHFEKFTASYPELGI